MFIHPSIHQSNTRTRTRKIIAFLLACQRRMRQQQVNLEVDVLAKYVERSVGPVIDQLKGEVEALQARVAAMEKGGGR